mgnify:CR=1 FL=1|jgi:membrane protein implicated in regulation of membrane protease activity
MSDKPIQQRVLEIVADVRQIATDEIQLTLAKIKPQAKDAGVGAGLLGAAGVLAVNTIPLFALAFAALFAWMYTTWFGVFPAVVLGFVTEAVLLLIVAGVLALIGKPKVERLTEVKPTVEASKARLLATVDMAKEAIESGKQKVAALESADTRELDRSA